MLDRYAAIQDDGRLTLRPYLRQDDFDDTCAFLLVHRGNSIIRISQQSQPQLFLQVRCEDVRVDFYEEGEACADFQFLPSLVTAGKFPSAKPLGTLQTCWGKAILCNPENITVHPEYPRPMLVRAMPYGTWKSLNGLWQCAIAPVACCAFFFPATETATYHGEILVPFCAESQLSGVQQYVGATNYLWYKRTCPLTETSLKDSRTLLHFGAIDWEATVYVNGQRCGFHVGGYTSFTVDITDCCPEEASAVDVTVRVWDPTNVGWQPRGKQVNAPHGIWYTPTTGIWQSVWLEQVPAVRVESVYCTCDIQQGTCSIHVAVLKPADVPTFLGHCHINIQADGQTVTSGSAVVMNFQDDLCTCCITVSIPSARHWSPEAPFLYDLDIRLCSEQVDHVLDVVQSYFAMREVAVANDAHGVPRLMLNRRPVFMVGLLDQGYWPDGILTPPSEEAMLFDLELTKRTGMNTVRKHVKVESQRWYAACDRLGLLVWQDMPSGDALAPWDPYGNHFGIEITRKPASMKNFREELSQLVRFCRPHPSVVCWVPFNEGWGQAQTAEIASWLNATDPGRLVCAASGGNDVAGAPGNLADWHFYPGPLPSKGQVKQLSRAGKIDIDDTFPKLDHSSRVLVLGEYGGLGLPIAGHLWKPSGANWGYRELQTKEQLTELFIGMNQTLLRLAHKNGLCAAIYTQTTDVELEVNGLVTYDRETNKVMPEKVVETNHLLVRCFSNRDIASM